MRELGHDVRAIDQELRLEGLPDADLVALAATEGRILVTNDVADFPRLLRGWAEARRTNAGVILLYGIDHREFRLIVRGIDRWCELRPQQDDWLSITVVVDRAFASA